jgi:hypothetical protein
LFCNEQAGQILVGLEEILYPWVPDEYNRLSPVIVGRFDFAMGAFPEIDG